MRHRPLIRVLAVCLGFAALLGQPAYAQKPPPVAVGTLQADLINSLNDAAQHSCNPKFSPLVAQACNQSIQSLGGQIASKGPITGAQFVGYQNPQGSQSAFQAAVFNVNFANGRMLWMISEDANGQITVFWTP